MNKGLQAATTLLAVLGLTTGSITLLPAGAAGGSAPGSAEADTYGSSVHPSLLRAQISPVEGPSSRAVVPPGTTQVYSTSLESCGQWAGNPCIHGNVPGSVLDYVNLVGGNSKATIGSESSTECAAPSQALPTGFNGGPLTGGSACSYLAQAGLLNQAGADEIVVGGVEAQSLTQSCTAQPEGHMTIAELKIGGIEVIGPGNTSTNHDPAPNTRIDVPNLASIILNEQVFDSQGHGLTVNAVHVFTQPNIASLAAADIILGHAHSMALCASGTTDTGTQTLCNQAGGPLTTSTPWPCQPLRPIVTIIDSTKQANPGETIGYTLSIDVHPVIAGGVLSQCDILSVVDVLPYGFAYVPGSDDGTSPFGAPTDPGPIGNGQQRLSWSRGGVAFPEPPNPIVDHFQVSIDAAEPLGMYVNQIYGLSTCGYFSGTDLAAVTSGPRENQGSNPGVIVPRGNLAPSHR